eukprot:1345089-Amorphochlora_amoeboformis.AAC.1
MLGVLPGTQTQETAGARHVNVTKAKVPYIFCRAEPSLSIASPPLSITSRATARVERGPSAPSRTKFI